MFAEEIDTPSREAELQASVVTPGFSAASAPRVRQFRQALLWPLRLLPVAGTGGVNRRPWEVLRELGDASPWREEFDEYTGQNDSFHERHYNEFVSFLPYVQQFLYGEGRSRHASGVVVCHRLADARFQAP